MQLAASEYILSRSLAAWGLHGAVGGASNQFFCVVVCCGYCFDKDPKSINKLIISTYVLA